MTERPATELFAIKTMLKVVEREVHEIRCLVCMYCDVIVGGDEARNIINPEVNDLPARVPHEHALEKFECLVMLQRQRRALPQRGYVGLAFDR